MPLVRYSTWLPDGRTLAMTPGPDGIAYTLDDRPIERAEAEAAWDDQPEEWQRGRSLDEALRHWRGAST